VARIEKRIRYGIEMLEVLDIPDIRKRIARITIERYHRMIDLGVFDEWSVELLNGVLVEKISKSELHVYLVDLLVELIREFCSGSEFWVRKEDPVTIGNSEPEPDVSVVKGSRSQFRHSKPATAHFVIEVSNSSLGLDRAKARDYAKAGIPEYWIVRPDSDLTEVYREPKDGEYAEMMEMPSGTTLESSALQGFSFNLAEALAE
jgi:Uma2 family endonuclease